MPSTKDIDISKKYLALFKGEPGTGKTRAACSFPKPFVFDFDGKLAVAKNIFPDKDIQYESYFNNFPGSMKRLEQLSTYCPYGTIIFDSLTSFARTVLNFMIKSRGGKGSLQRGGLDVPQIEDYGGETAAMIQLIDFVRLISERGIKVIIIAHVVEISEKNIKTQQTTVARQLLTGGKKIAAELPAYFDEAYHFYHEGGFDGKPDFKAYTLNAGEDWAKSALPLPNPIKWTNKNFYDTLIEIVPSLDRKVVEVEKKNNGFQ